MAKAKGEETIGSPYPDRLDILCCMTESAYDTYGAQLRDGGLVVINTTLFGERKYPDNVKVLGIDTQAVTESVGNERGANLALLGAMAKGCDLIDVSNEELLLGCLNKKFKGNYECFKGGYDQAIEIK